MKIQLNTDNNIEGSEKLDAYITDKFKHAFAKYSDHLTRIEIHLADLNGQKSGADDIQCKIESRLEGKQPVVVSSKEGSQEKAIDSAIQKMKAALDTIVGKMKNK